MRNILLSLSVVLFLLGQGCASKKVKPPLTIGELQSKRVAIAEVQAEGESQKHVEIAIINEIIDHGRFEVVDRTTVQDALATYPHESDWQRLGKKTGANYVLSARVTDFSVTERKGYDKIEEEDSVLTEEQRSDEPVTGTRYEKVKSYSGTVKIDFKFFDVEENALTYLGTGTATETANSRDKKKFPGKMALLERLTKKSVSDFFSKMPK